MKSASNNFIQSKQKIRRRFLKNYIQSFENCFFIHYNISFSKKRSVKKNESNFKNRFKIYVYEKKMQKFYQIVAFRSDYDEQFSKRYYWIFFTRNSVWIQHVKNSKFVEQWSNTKTCRKRQFIYSNEKWKKYILKKIFWCNQFCSNDAKNSLWQQT